MHIAGRYGRALDKHSGACIRLLVDHQETARIRSELEKLTTFHEELVSSCDLEDAQPEAKEGPCRRLMIAGAD